MKTLLRIDAGVRHSGSHSRALADHYERCWQKVHPGGRVIRRDLAANPPPHLDEATVAVFYAGGDPGNGPVPAGIRVSDTLIAELRAADDVVVSSGVYNFNITSTLKAWIDHIVRFGHTIARGEDGRVSGLLGGRSVCVLFARGGNAQTSPEYPGASLRALFQYIGFSRIEEICLEGTGIPDGKLPERLAAARAAVNALFGLPVED
jgi:FMN-dependent NADH-azoreductase